MAFRNINFSFSVQKTKNYKFHETTVAAPSTVYVMLFHSQELQTNHRRRGRRKMQFRRLRYEHKQKKTNSRKKDNKLFFFFSLELKIYTTRGRQFRFALHRRKTQHFCIRSERNLLSVWNGGKYLSVRGFRLFGRRINLLTARSST